MSFLKIGGKDKDGNAKGINVDGDGNIITGRSGVLETVHQDGTTNTSNGTKAAVEGFNTVAIEVTGEFEATMIVRGTVFGDLPAEPRPTLPVIDYLGNHLMSIKKEGIYYLSVTGLKEIDVRVDNYTSGSVTVKSRAMAMPLNAFAIHKKKIHLIDSWKGESIAADTVENWGFNIDQFPINFVQVRADSSHDWSVTFNYTNQYDSDFGGSIAPSVTAIDAEDELRSQSEWIKVRSDYLTMYVRNKDTESSHTYDILLFGVR